MKKYVVVGYWKKPMKLEEVTDVNGKTYTVLVSGDVGTIFNDRRTINRAIQRSRRFATLMGYDMEVWGTHVITPIE